MQRNCYTQASCEFRCPGGGGRVESLAMCAGGQRLFVGTGDGQLVLYDCKNLAQANGGGVCSVVDTIRKSPKDRKPVSQLQVIESWRVLIGIMDGMIMAYDSQSYQMVSQLLDTKGCHLFAVHERSSLLAVANKKKVSIYQWQESGLVPKRELMCSEVPKSVLCVTGAVIVGFKKYYEIIDLTPGGINGFARLPVEVDKEHRMVGLEICAVAGRPSSTALLSIGSGLQGALLDMSSFAVRSRLDGAVGEGNNLNAHATSTQMTTAPKISFGDRLEWSSQPISLHLLMPFIVTLQDGGVEVHDLASLSSLQRMTISVAPSTFSSSSIGAGLTMCSSVVLPGVEQAFLSNGETLSALKMVPLHLQVAALMDAGLYEDAINLCAMTQSMVGDVDLGQIHEKYGTSLLQKGDFDGAMTNYIAAKTSPLVLLRRFPDLVPTALHASAGVTSSATSAKLTGVVLHRAAAAMANFCAHHRPAVSQQADRAEKVKSAGIGASIDGGDPDEALRMSELVDTVLLFSLVLCSPPRRAAVIDVLSSKNRCHIESSAVLLASQGNAFTEALLWLYRSRNEHRRVLAALTEDRCVGTGAWTKDQFHTWMAEYLRWLWYHDDPSLPQLALSALRPVLEYDANLGLSVLTARPKGKASFGGKNVTVQEVISFLESVQPSTLSARFANNSAASVNSSAAKKSSSNKMRHQNSTSGDVAIPLINGRALGVSYLEWLVGSGAAPPSMHDEFAQLLMEGIPLEKDMDHRSNDLEIKGGDSESILLYKIYRKKLQLFLQTSSEYHPDRILKFLPQQFLHEYALLLSRLGKHEEVLRIYVEQLGDLVLAEAYCQRTYDKFKTTQVLQQHQQGVEQANANINITEANVYLVLAETLLASSQSTETLATVIQLAERNFDRMDPCVLLDLLPPSVPLAQLSRYLCIVIEHNNTKKRNLQIVHQLLRVREVNLRTTATGSAVGSKS